MEILIKVLQFFMSLSLLVAIHEFGHFIMARVFKIRVEKFYIFFDPWFSLFKFKRGDTEYGVGWLPLGGYVKIAGMIDESMDTEQMQQPIQPWEFRAKPAWQRFLVMIAGVVMNILLAILIYCAICWVWGENYFSNKDAIYGYNFNEQAEELGFVDGDKIISIDGEEIDNVIRITNMLLIPDKERDVVVERDGKIEHIVIPFEKLIELRQTRGVETFSTLVFPFIIDSISYPAAVEAGLMRDDRIVALNGERMVDFNSYSEKLQQLKGEIGTFTIQRQGEELELSIPIDTAGRIGVMVKDPTTFYKMRTQNYSLLEAIPAGINKCGRTISSYWEQLKLIAQPKTKMYEELGGFIAIGSIFSSEWNWLDFWLKTAFLSIILAIMNILPIPGLDGGHAIFTLWEMLTGRKLSDKFLEVAQWIGLIILFALLLYANGNDIYRFFIK